MALLGTTRILRLRDVAWLEVKGKQDLSFHAVLTRNNYVCWYIALIHQTYAPVTPLLLPLLIRRVNRSWNHLSSLGSMQLNYSQLWHMCGCKQTQQPTLPSQVIAQRVYGEEAIRTRPSGCAYVTPCMILWSASTLNLTSATLWLLIFF